MAGYLFEITDKDHSGGVDFKEFIAVLQNIEALEEEVRKKHNDFLV